MHKYLPKIMLIKLSSELAGMSYEHLQRHWEEVGLPNEATETFVFAETAFITVTAYQNQQVL